MDKKHNKHYGNETHLKHHFSNYQNTLKDIEKLNAQNNGATFAPNQFSDLSDEEFSAQFTGAKVHGKPKGGVPYKNLQNSRTKRATLPDNFDWRDKNAVTSVKNQAKCGCCYAFASLASTESVFYIANNYTYDMSEQQIVSCSPDTQNQGCAGGYIDETLETIAKNGVGLEDEYPYTSGTTGNVTACVENQPRYAFISNYTVVTSYDEDEMKEAIYTKGPAVVVIDSRQLKSYDKGILDPVKPADGWKIDHAVSVIGYGVNAKGVTFWWAKNSWGSSWGGLNGFFKVRRGTNALDLGNTILIPLV
uniref:Pept_C1 domain-containing protein n=1 Tax=Bursaphelenchus xylophilus TaxID=6326 RepID=A0A1I7SBX5_BURXY